MAKTPTDHGSNLTGIGTSPIDGAALIEGPSLWPPTSAGDDQNVLNVRAEYITEAEPIGTMPPPSTLKGAIAIIAKKFKGEKVTVFLDKLGERLAFERSGARLYQAFAVKVKLATDDKGTPPLKEVEKIYQDELKHMHLVKEALETLGADPTVMTPSADITAVMSIGLVQVLTDPRTTVADCLGALLTAELTDTAGWELLIQLARQMNQPELATQFTEALQQEQKHLALIKKWVSEAALIESGVEPSPPSRQPRKTR